MKIYVEFDDHYGQRVRVTGSSLAARAAVLVYVTREAVLTVPVRREIDECLHLTFPQAQMLRAGLDEWLADVEEER